MVLRFQELYRALLLVKLEASPGLRGMNMMKGIRKYLKSYAVESNWQCRPERKWSLQTFPVTCSSAGGRQALDGAIGP